jgi:hypothetical protein
MAAGQGDRIVSTFPHAPRKREPVRARSAWPLATLTRKAFPTRLMEVAKLSRIQLFDIFRDKSVEFKALSYIFNLG